MPIARTTTRAGLTGRQPNRRRCSIFSAFSCRLITRLRKEHLEFRRETFFSGRNIEAKGFTDIDWLRSDGQKMTSADWQDLSVSAFGCVLEEGRHAILFNPSADAVSFAVPFDRCRVNSRHLRGPFGGGTRFCRRHPAIGGAKPRLASGGCCVTWIELVELLCAHVGVQPHYFDIAGKRHETTLATKFSRSKH